MDKEYDYILDIFNRPYDREKDIITCYTCEDCEICPIKDVCENSDNISIEYYYDD